MQQATRTPSSYGLYVATALCLFALAALALQVWRSPPSRTPPTERLAGSHATDRIPRAPVLASPEAEAPVAAPAASPARVGLFDLVDLSEYPAPAGVAEIRPAVTDRFDEPDSVAESFELSIVEQQPLVSDRIERPVLEVEPAETGLSSRAPEAIVLVPTTDSRHSLPKASAPATASVANVWPFPRELFATLDHLVSQIGSEEVASWAESVRIELYRLTSSDSFDSPVARQALDELARIHERGLRLTSQLSPDDQATMLRSAHALNRRLRIWTQLRAVAAKPVFTSFERDSGVDLHKVLRAVEQSLSGTAGAENWRRYLMLPELNAGAKRAVSGPDRAFTTLVRRALGRIDSPQLTHDQAHFLDQPVFEELRLALQRYATEPVDYRTVLDQLESVEAQGDSASATGVADAYQILRWSPDADVAALSQEIESHYRNGNIRVAISKQLLERMLPQPSAYDEPLDDDFMGARVRGTSRAISQLRLVLIPDRYQWRMDLEAVGAITSDTSAEKGPAQLLTQGRSQYYARKPLIIDRRGVRVRGAEVNSNTEADLAGVRTNLDGVPLVGALARAIAVNQHRQSLPLARSMTDQRVASRARQVFDEEVGRQLRKAEQDFDRRLMAPLRKLNLQPVAVDMQTTDERLIARYRLAGERQLAGNTPRPQAPSDSYLSLQVHESAFNNALDNLQFAGRRTDLREFVLELSRKYDQGMLPVSLDEVPENVVIEFAERDPFRICLQDGFAKFIMRFDEIESAEGKKWRDFSVQIRYRTQVEGQQANLVREGPIEISGQRLSGIQRLSLRPIFTKLFPQSRPIHLTADHLKKNPKLHDLAVTQFVIADGWFGLAFAPREPAPAIREAELRPRFRRR